MVTRTALNDAGKTVLYALILGGVLVPIAVARGQFDAAAIISAAAFAVALIITLAARANRKRNQ